MSEAGQEAVWIQRLLGELGERQPQPTQFNCDNQAAIHLGKNPATHQRTKHIDIRHHILRDMVENKPIVTSLTSLSSRSLRPTSVHIVNQDNHLSQLLMLSGLLLQPMTE